MSGDVKTITDFFDAQKAYYVNARNILSLAELENGPAIMVLLRDHRLLLVSNFDQENDHILRGIREDDGIHVAWKSFDNSTSAKDFVTNLPFVQKLTPPSFDNCTLSLEDTTLIKSKKLM